MKNPGFYGIRKRILKYLDHQDLEQLCKIWSEDDQLWRTSWIKFMEEFGDTKWLVYDPIPDWDTAIEKVSAKATLEDLGEIKDSLITTLSLPGFEGKRYPVHEIAIYGSVKLMEFIFHTSFDMNSRNQFEETAFQTACVFGNLEMVRFLIRSSREQADMGSNSKLITITD